MKVEKETAIEIKKMIINICNSVEDNCTGFQDGMYIGQILAYSNVLGIYPPSGMCEPVEIFEWAKDTFK